MSDYVFVSGPSGMAEGILRASYSALLGALAYRAERVESFTSPNRRMAALQFARSTRLYDASEQRYEDESGKVTLLKGHVIRKGLDDAHLASAKGLAADIARRGISSLHRAYSGDYGICHFDGERATFASDPLSMVSLFYHVSADGFTIVSTRPRLIQAIRPELQFDYRSLAWQAIAYWPLGVDTLVEKVRRVSQGGWLEVDEGGAALHERPLFFLNRDDGGEMREALTRNPEAVLDRVIGQMASTLRAVLDKGSRVDLAVTGGRDSRAIAALATASGASPGNLKCFSNGVAEHPDVVVGRMVAEAIGANFTNNLPRPSSFSFPDIFKQRLAAVFRYDGMVPIWDGGGGPGISSAILLQGHVGEIYRDKWFQASYTSASQFAQRMFAGSGVDPNKLLHKDVSADLEKQLAERAQYYLDHGATPAQLGGVFRIEGMQSWESSQFSQGALWASHPVHPLYDPDMIDLSFLAPDGWRDDERIHFEITKRSQFNLIDVPFAEHGWHRGLALSAGCSAVNVPPIRNSGQLVSAAGWQSALFFESPLQRMFLRVIEECDQSPLWTFFDKKRTISAIVDAPPDIPNNKMTRLYSLLTSLLYAHGYEIPIKFDAEPGANEVESRIVLNGSGGTRVIYDGRQKATPVDTVSTARLEGVPELDVPEMVIGALHGTRSGFDDDQNLYKLYGKLRQAVVGQKAAESKLRAAREELAKRSKSGVDPS